MSRIGCLLLAFIIASCTPSPPSARYTVDQYRTDDRLRQDQVARCKNDPGTLSSTPDCVNALEAERLQGIGSFRDLPPLRLPEP